MRFKIRCDDVFADTNPVVVDRIWFTIHEKGFNHIIGVTPIGKGEPIYHEKPLKRGNKWITSASGDKCIVENRELLNVIKRYLNLGSELALHGYRHINYTLLSYDEQLEHLELGKLVLEKLFNITPTLFIPPFNKADNNTEKACRKTGYTIVPSYHPVDTALLKQGDVNIDKIVKQSIEKGNCTYHPYWLNGNWKPRTVKTDEKTYIVLGASWNLETALPVWRTFLDKLGEKLG